MPKYAKIREKQKKSLSIYWSSMLQLPPWIQTILEQRLTRIPFHDKRLDCFGAILELVLVRVVAAGDRVRGRATEDGAGEGGDPGVRRADENGSFRFAHEERGWYGLNEK